MKSLIIALTLTALLFLGVAYILVEASDNPDLLVANRDIQCEGFSQAFDWIKNATTYDEMYDALRVWDIALNRCRKAVDIIELYERGL